MAGYRPLQDPPRADLARAQKLLGCFRAVLRVELDAVVSRGPGRGSRGPSTTLRPSQASLLPNTGRAAGGQGELRVAVAGPAHCPPDAGPHLPSLRAAPGEGGEAAGAGDVPAQGAGMPGPQVTEPSDRKGATQQGRRHCPLRVSGDVLEGRWRRNDLMGQGDRCATPQRDSGPRVSVRPQKGSSVSWGCLWPWPRARTGVSCVGWEAPS